MNQSRRYIAVARLIAYCTEIIPSHRKPHGKSSEGKKSWRDPSNWAGQSLPSAERVDLAALAGLSPWNRPPVLLPLPSHLLSLHHQNTSTCLSYPSPQCAPCPVQSHAPQSRQPGLGQANHSIVHMVMEQETGLGAAQRCSPGKHSLQQQPSMMALSSPAKFIAAPQGNQIASQGHLQRGCVPPHKL